MRQVEPLELVFDIFCERQVVLPDAFHNGQRMDARMRIVEFQR